MGSALSRSKKIIESQPNTSNFSCSTTSSGRTMVESTTTNSLPGITTTERATTEFSPRDKKRKSSILPNNNFFINIRIMGSRTTNNNKRDKQHFNHPVNMNNSSLSRRKPRHNNNKRKKKANVVTKSIIGRPTNFKHLNTSTDFNHMQILKDSDEEAAKVTAQMIILSSLIKPLPANDDIKIPIIPPRFSSYGNSIYLEKENPVKPLSSKVAPARKAPGYSSSINTSSIKKSKKEVVGMNNHGSIPSRSSVAARNRRTAAHRAAKKKAY